MMRLCGPISILCVGVLTLSACGEPEFDPPERGEQIQAAHRIYTPALFDTIEWQDDVTRAHRGNEVYASKCRNCHGTVGEGTTEYARERDLHVPSLVTADWPFAESLDSVRHRIFVGHELGMPTWGVAGISPREIDAAAFYLLEILRPEILGN